MVNELIKEIKTRSNIIDVAKLVGINLNRANKCLCPFHSENTPSFSISEKKQIFKCFGCGETGDSITLVSKILNIKPYKAAQYINDSLALGLNLSKNKCKSEFKFPNKYKQKMLILEEFKRVENEIFILLSDYRRYLAEKNDDETAMMLEQIDYYLDIFIEGDERDKLQFLINNKKIINKLRMGGNYIE
ncbi:DNA primase [Clostridium disporicum]|uniref:DNA primase n=1 Tax=Clostridium disporicum TaxID=84024 RepID=A0A174AHW7_9CLOT|nr:CHC2 zinc finger domain-containing protein [Clostridium disporicum]CUN87125.1 DNA primase [Clostridium disporicum]